MSNKIKVEVTQDHIDNGQKVNCEKCPVALALQEAFNNPDARSMSYGIEIPEDGEVKFYGSVPEVETFMHKFDNDKEVEPFTFYISK